MQHMEKYTEELNLEVQLSIQKVSERGEAGFELYNSSYGIVKKAFGDLRDFIYQYKFKDKEEEVLFFKEIKPGFESKILYYLELIQLEARKPTISEKRQLLKYYREAARYYQMVLKRNDLFRQYLRSGHTVSDHYLFLRSEDSHQLIPTDNLDIDDRFSTAASSELAKIKSHEMLLDYLRIKIEALKSGDPRSADEAVDNYDTTWTGDKVELIELAYALYASGNVNNGKATIKQIIAALERAFNIDLSGFYRVFQNIRIRLSGRTKFIDFLKMCLTEFMDETDLR
jgi:hypothetical protein